MLHNTARGNDSYGTLPLVDGTPQSALMTKGKAKDLMQSHGKVG